MPPDHRSLKRSRDYLARAEKVLPGYASCYSRAPLSYARGSYPSYVEQGRGCELIDVDGNVYIDTTMGLCPVILGYSHPSTLGALAKYAEKGPLFTLPHRLEVELAEKMVEMIPCAEMVRFGKNGADATTAAVRLAREVTGRDHIAMCGYHGWQDWYIVTTDQNGGIPNAVAPFSHKFVYNDIDSLSALFDRHPGQIACVIMEPMSVVWPDPGYLEAVKTLTHRNGALLIFDEIVTGFRWALKGAQGYFGVTPDLATFAKCMSNGFPISALAGRADLMSRFALGHAFWSTTYGNESLSMAVALETLTYLQENPVIDFIWVQGKTLHEGFNAIAAENGLGEYVESVGAPPRSVQIFRNLEKTPDLAVKTLFQQECVRRGVITLGCHNVSYAHTDPYVERILSVYREVLGVMGEIYRKGDRAEDYLDGPPAEPVFRRI
ncbi:MAG: aminotransferase class III-fold pyridoxal phosphate-dependent enzyme [Pseudomonadota bacterium]